MIAYTFIQLFNTGLNMADLVSMIILGTVLLMLIAGQRRALNDARRVMKMIIHLTLISEEDSRKNRHALKDMATTLKLQKLAESLEPSLPDEERLQPGSLVSKLIAVASESDEDADRAVV